MEPLTTASLISGGLGAGASAYGAWLQDQQAKEALAYQKQRDALSDEEQRRLRVREILEQSRQNQAYYAGQNVPTGVPGQ